MSLPNSSQSDEAKVCRSCGIPVLTYSEEDGTNEDEAEDEDEVDGDRDHDQVSGHVALFSNFIKTDSFCSSVYAWW